MFVGAVVLADALIDLANHDDLAADMVERLSSDPQELIKKVKRKITGLKRIKRRYWTCLSNCIKKMIFR
jgi:DNA repair ATPase RecN